MKMKKLLLFIAISTLQIPLLYSMEEEEEFFILLCQLQKKL